MIQQNPKKQVTTKREKKETTATMVTSYTGFPEERIEPEFHYLNYPRKAIFSFEVQTFTPCKVY